MTDNIAMYMWHNNILNFKEIKLITITSYVMKLFIVLDVATCNICIATLYNIYSYIGIQRGAPNIVMTLKQGSGVQASRCYL